jgi:hypothetical protein
MASTSMPIRHPGGPEMPRATRIYSLTFATVFLLVNLYFLYRFYIAGIRLIPLGPVLFYAGALTYGLRVFVSRIWLRRCLIAIAYLLCAGTLWTFVHFA